MAFLAYLLNDFSRFKIEDKMVVKNCKAIAHKTHEKIFIIERIADFGAEKYMVLVNDDKRRMVDFTLYSKFGLAVGDEITCVHKKENCAGDLVSMILHPRYKMNECYNFNVISIEQEEISGYKLFFLLLGDDFGFEHKIRINESDIQKYGDDVTCRVVGISPGKLNLFVEKI